VQAIRLKNPNKISTKSPFAGAKTYLRTAATQAGQVPRQGWRPAPTNERRLVAILATTAAADLISISYGALRHVSGHRPRPSGSDLHQASTRCASTRSCRHRQPLLRRGRRDDQTNPGRVSPRYSRHAPAHTSPLRGLLFRIYEIGHGPPSHSYALIGIYPPTATETATGREIPDASRGARAECLLPNSGINRRGAP
jgi:hypothetical protein